MDFIMGRTRKRFRPITIPFALLFTAIYMYYMMHVKPGSPLSLPALEGLQIKVKHRPEVCTELTKKGDLVKVKFTAYRDTDGEKVIDSPHPVTLKLGFCKIEREEDELLCTPGVIIGLTQACIGEKRTLHLKPNVLFGDEGNKILKISGTESILVHATIQDFDSF